MQTVLLKYCQMYALIEVALDLGLSSETESLQSASKQDLEVMHAF